MQLTIFSIMLSSLLFTAVAVPTDATFPRISKITLSQVPNVTYFGAEMKITGQLVDAATGEGLPNREIQVINNEPSGSEVLFSTETRKYGYFVASWKNQTENTMDTTMHLLVSYDGSEEYTASVSREHTVTVKLLPLEVEFLYLKNVYNQGESTEIIFTVSSLGKPVEPDVLRVIFNSKVVNPAVYGKGNYVYETDPLSADLPNQFFVGVSKDGYESTSRMITLRVV